VWLEYRLEICIGTHLGYFEEADNCNLYAGTYYDSLSNLKQIL